MPESNQMSFDDPMPQLAEAIRGLELAPLQTPVEQMCFAAGFEAGRKRAGTWLRVGAMIALAAGAIVVWDHRPAQHLQSPNYVKRITQTEHDGGTLSEQTFSTVTTATNLRLRQAVLSEGWDALPPSAGADSPPLRPLESLPPDSRQPRT